MSSANHDSIPHPPDPSAARGTASLRIGALIIAVMGSIIGSVTIALLLLGFQRAAVSITQSPHPHRSDDRSGAGKTTFSQV